MAVINNSSKPLLFDNNHFDINFAGEDFEINLKEEDDLQDAITKISGFENVQVVQNSYGLVSYEIHLKGIARDVIITSTDTFVDVEVTREMSLE